MVCNEERFDVVELLVKCQLKAFSINLNALHVNGITHFDYTVNTGKLVKIHTCTVITYIVCGLK